MDNVLTTLSALADTFVGQEKRILKLDSVLGPDVLLPQRMVGSERLGRGYDYTIDLVCTRDDIELKKLIAQPVTLWLQQDGSHYAPLHGYVHTARRLGSDGQLASFQIGMAPWLHFLRYRKDARIWQDSKADDILADVFDQHAYARGNYRFEIVTPALPRSYCTQYETDWHFVQRLMEEEGWYAYHEQKPDGSGHVLVITDNTDQAKPLAPEQLAFHGAGTQDEVNRILHWSASRGLASTRLATRTDDYKSPGDQKQTQERVLPEHGALPGELEVYEYSGPYSYAKQDDGDRQARLRVEQWESSMKRFTGVSGARTLAAGRWFTLTDHPAHRGDSKQDSQFMLIAVEWFIENNLPLSGTARDFPGSLKPQLDAFKASMGRSNDDEGGNARTGHCFNRFEVQRRKLPYRSPFDHTKPVMHPQTAVVVGPQGEEVFTDKLNRVKVQFRWDRINPGDEKASCWVRVSYPNAGENWGEVKVPRVGQELIISFLNGDPDRPVATGRLFNQEQPPQWHTDGRLSGLKSKEFGGSGFNQLVMDDTTSQNRVHLYSSQSNAQLNLGYLVSQADNERRNFYGSGFALSTDDYGAVVTQKGLYLSSYGRPGPQGTQLDASEATSLMKASADLARGLSDSASKAGAEALAQDSLKDFVDATEDKYSGQGQGSANRFKKPLLMMAAPAGIGLATDQGTQVHSAQETTLTSGKDTSIASGKSLLATVKEKISLFAQNAGMKLFAAKGKVEIQAQSDDLDLIAEKVARLLSTSGRVEIHAKDEVMISAGGSFIQINSAGITQGTPGKWEAKASLHSMPGPASQNFVMPHVQKSELQPSDMEFRHLTDWGEPLAGAAYKAILSDGSVRKGTLDAQGIARLSGVPAGASAKVEYNYQPLQASSMVDTELHEDVHELLNWAPKVLGALGKGGKS
ncbi:type VI secretion system Vgr family protein [Herbaspirillum seropedicae]|uniref:type VI secretion system Vgr family protein n=1 Tax=Herbaspirillum seropedicae TaxID=964 RepID=UPI003FCD27CD